jgi:formylglycine-generating enzyme required for sulfatase activity
MQRHSDGDTLVLRSGERRSGTLRNDAFHLQTPGGELVFPAPTLAGIDLSDARSGLVVVVTANLDRFSGFLVEPAFVLEAPGATTPVQLRREDVLKVVLHQRASAANPRPGSALILLRNGDFFRAEPLDFRLRVESTGAETNWSAGDITCVTPAADGTDGVELQLKNRQVVLARLADDDFEFQLASGNRLRVHRSRVQEIRRASALPPELMSRVGAVPRELAGRREASPPDPRVVPVENMVWIPPGEFVMGSPPEEKGRDLDEGPQTRVVLPQGFWIGRYETTQAEYETLTGANPSRYAGDGRLPVEKVTWAEAVDYCRQLTEREHAAGRLPADYDYRLPTEAEWEFACRAGTSSRFSHGDDAVRPALPEFAWFGDNSDSTPHPVGTKSPNPWGLHDMHGNVLEWCLDPWQGSLRGGTVTNTAPLAEGTLRVARGGSWLYPARAARSANRDSYGVLNRCSDLGFRVVLVRRLEAPAAR